MFGLLTLAIPGIMGLLARLVLSCRLDNAALASQLGFDDLAAQRPFAAVASALTCFSVSGRCWPFASTLG